MVQVCIIVHCPTLKVKLSRNDRCRLHKSLWRTFFASSVHSLRKFSLANRASFSNFFQFNGDGGSGGSGGGGSASSSSPAASPPPSTALGENEMATMTDPDTLGPCEPGTAVKLEGVVHHVTDRGERQRERGRPRPPSVPERTMRPDSETVKLVSPITTERADERGQSAAAAMTPLPSLTRSHHPLEQLRQSVSQ